MIEIVYSKEVNKKDEYLRLPKNIRQTGIVEEHKKVYIEDYVNTYMEQFLEDTNESRGILILTGKTVYNSLCDYAFISGCIWMRDIEIIGREIFFDNNIWMSIYAKVREYFPHSDIVGWAMVFKDEMPLINDAVTKIHKDNFPGREKILIIKELLEKEEKIFNMENGIFREHKGYYIYYEKNLQMQNYMICEKENNIPLESCEDKAAKSFRKLIKEKEEIKRKKTRMLSGTFTTATAGAIILLLAFFAYDNYDRLDSMQASLEYISDTIGDNYINEWFKTELTDNSDITDNTEKTDISDSTKNSDISDSANITDNDKALINSNRLANALDDSNAQDGKVVVTNIEGMVEKADANNTENDNTNNLNNTDNTNTVNPSENTNQESANNVNNNNADNTNQNENTNQENANNNENTNNVNNANNINNTDNGQVNNENINNENINNENTQSQNQEDLGGSVTEIANSENEIKETINQTNNAQPANEAKQESPQNNKYLVKSGDSLEKISMKLYGNNGQVDEICRLNNITDVDKIYIGQELIVP